MEEQIKEKREDLREEKFPVEDQIVEKQEGKFLVMSCWGSVRSSPGSTSSTTRKEGLHAARIWGISEKEQIVGKLGGFKTSVDLHVSEFLVPDVWGGIIGPGWQDHNAKDKNSPATLSATTRSPDSSTGLSGKLKVLDRAIGGCKRDDPSG